jgi:chromosome segregation ATPase
MVMAVTHEAAEQNGTVSNGLLDAANHHADLQTNGVPKELPSSQTEPATEVDPLRQENNVLRETVAELEKMLEQMLQAEQTWTERQKEQEMLLEEKSDVIRELHVKLQEHAAVPAPREGGAAPHEDELVALSEALEQERCQLKDDEETLMAQMREMEIQMSRERAELARQRNDLQRLHNEIRHELELAARQAELRDRLLPLQRRHQEMLHRKGAEPSPEAPSSSSAPPAAPAAAPAPTGKDSSGLLRRLFG